MANTRVFVLASKRPSIKERCNLRVRFAEPHKLRSKLESETLNQTDTSFLTPSTADNIHQSDQTAHWKILGNEGDADPFLKKDEVCTTERIATGGSNTTYV